MDKNNSIKKRTTAALLAVQICVMALVGCTIGNGNKTGTLTPGSSILPAPKKSIKEATQILKEAELGVELKQEENQEIDKTETVVTQQLPLPGVKVKKGSKIEIEY